MKNSFLDIKKNALVKRQSTLVEQYFALNGQLLNTLDAGEAVKLKNKLVDLEQKLEDLENQLAQIERQLHKGEIKNSFSNASDSLGEGNKWSVLVGVNEYQDKLNYSDLTVCVKDTEAIYETLAAKGFSKSRTSVITDITDRKPTRNNILTSLHSLSNAAQKEDLLLFYYSGHGDIDEDESFLLTSDGTLPALRDTALPIRRVVEILQKSVARAKVIIIDACHSGAATRRKSSKAMSAEFISRVFEQSEGIAIIASCKQGQLSYEWESQERSVFTHYLLEALNGKADLDEKKFVTVQDVNRYVSNGVAAWAFQHNVSQNPTLQYQVTGDIILTDFRASKI